MAKCAASNKLAKSRSEHLYTYAHAPVTALRLYALYDAALLLLQAAAISKMSAEHSTALLAMQSHGRWAV